MSDFWKEIEEKAKILTEEKKEVFSKVMEEMKKS